MAREDKQKLEGDFLQLKKEYEEEKNKTRALQ